jgi:predicted metal-dependent enzyme (double-stranded beta helix superfamily)
VYDLTQFCDELREILKSEGQAGLSKVAERLKRLLANPEFVAATFNDEMTPGKRVLYHDPETDAYVLAHVQAANKTGQPHSHGASWAVYGNAKGATQMTLWRRVNPESEERFVLEPAERYSLEPGQARPFPSGAIHSTAQVEGAWVIRVTGTDLDVLPRYHFKKGRDEILTPA